MRFFLLLFILFTGCATRIHQQFSYDYSFGNFQKAEEKVTRCMNSNDAVLLFLNRGMIRFASGNSQEAIQDFKCALEAIDLYDEELFIDALDQLLIHDESAPYRGDDFEQTLARLYFALVLLDNSDESNACAILQQAEEVNQKKHNVYHRNAATERFVLSDNTIQKALFSFLLAKRGDISNANILRKQVPFSLPEYDSEKALLIVFCHNGLAPFKVSSYCSASIASAFAIERILENCSFDPAICSSLGVPIPELCAPFSYYPVPLTLRIENYCKPLQTFCNIGFLAEQELQYKLPYIAAKAAARAILRRTLVGSIKEKDRNLGAIVDIGMFIANASTKADTRSWNTLPMAIDAAFVSLDVGIHNLQFESAHHDYCYCRSLHNIQLQKGDICVVNVFNLHPGITKVIIPRKYKIEVNQCIK